MPHQSSYPYRLLLAAPLLAGLTFAACEKEPDYPERPVYNVPPAADGLATDDEDR